VGSLVAVSLLSDEHDASYQSCIHSSRTDCRAPLTPAAYAVGIPLLAAGVALPIGAIAVLIRHPVRPDEARQMADDYNRQLVRQLGLEAPPPRPEHTAPPTLSLSPMLSPGLAGLSLRLTM
jgi:hypothetical protein